MNFNFFFQLTFFLKLLANFIPRIKFFRAKMIKIGLESWDALGSCNIASPAESMNPRSLPDQEKQSDPERPRTPRANYAHDLRTYNILNLKTTSTQSISSVPLRHKLTQSKTFINTKRYTYTRRRRRRRTCTRTCDPASDLGSMEDTCASKISEDTLRHGLIQSVS